ncbi:hypothetical protein RRF57_002641 [Xylaria bambusicola]|uniref:Uncharacterized protein n=1 Tax=Xylaria bambusicola TaxID=326684 RepID=A0AAN7UJ00_9PEZI
MSNDGPLDSVIPLAATVELGNGYEPVEEPMTNADVAVDCGEPVPEGEPVLEAPGNPDVELPALIVTEPDGVGTSSVEKLNALVRLPLALTEVSSSEEMDGVVGDNSEPLLLGSPVGPPVMSVELVIENGGLLDVRAPDVKVCDMLFTLDVSIEEAPPDAVPETTDVDALIFDPDGNGVGEVTENVVETWLGNVSGPLLPVGYGPVPDTDSLELLSGKGAVGEVLKNGVPDEMAVTLLVVSKDDPGRDSAGVEENPVPDRLPVPLFASVVELPKG